MSSENRLKSASFVCGVLVVAGLCVYLIAVRNREGPASSQTRSQRSSGIGDGGISSCDCTSSTHSSYMICRTPDYGCDATNEVQHNGSCYRFFPGDLKSRDESHRDCIDRDSHLVYVESDDERTFLEMHAASLARSDYWIGLFPAPTWSDGIPIPPNLLPIFDSGGSRSYLYFYDGRYQIIKCYCTRFSSRRLRPFCERPKPDGSMGCSSGLPEFDDSCYEVVNRWLRYSEARERCEENEGHLLYIESEAEFNFIKLLLNRDRSYWIGDIRSEYRWLDGSPATELDIESFSGNQVCFRFRPRRSNGRLTFRVNDQDCDGNFGYICERKVVNLTAAQSAQDLTHCPVPIPEDLVRLGRRSDSLCIGGGYSTPILHECETGRGIDECGCVKETRDGAETITCSCGFCSLTNNKLEEDSTDVVWSSTFDCSCSDGKTTVNVTVANGEMTCLSNDAPSTTANPGGQASGQAGVAVGVTLALVFLLVALVAFLAWRKKSGKQCILKSERDGQTLTPPNSTDVGSEMVRVNPTYGIGVDKPEIEAILKPTAVPGTAASKPKPREVYADTKVNADTEAEDYSTIPARGYTPYTPQQGDGGYTDLKRTDEDDDPGVYTPVLNDPKTRTDGSDGEYVDPQTIETPSQGKGAGRTAAPNLRPTGKNPQQSGGYVDVDASIVVFGDKSIPEAAPNQKDGGDYVDVDAPAVVFADGSGLKAPSEKTPGGAGYVSVDSPPVSPQNQGDQDQDYSSPENNYYFKLEKPATDETETDLTSPIDENDQFGLSDQINAYDTFNRPGNRQPACNVPTNDNDYSLTSPPSSNDYDTFNRTGNTHSSDGMSEEGDYSLAGAPPGDDDYATFNRAGGKPRPDGLATDNSYSSLAPSSSGTAITDDTEYGTID